MTAIKLHKKVLLEIIGINASEFNIAIKLLPENKENEAGLLFEACFYRVSDYSLNRLIELIKEAYENAAMTLTRQESG